MATALERAAPAQLPAQSETVTLLDVIKRAAADPSVDVEKMERLMAMHERIVARQAEADFNEAMVACQTDMGPIAAAADNPQTKSKYAKYQALDHALRPIYTKHGFSVTFDTADGAPADHVRVVCLVSHKGGHTRASHIDMPADGKGAKGGDVMTKTHATGSAITYGRRYVLLMAFNLVVGVVDDDGNRAGSAAVTSKQAEDLEALADEVGANKTSFLKYVGASSFATIRSMDYEGCVAALQKKRKA